MSAEVQRVDLTARAKPPVFVNSPRRDRLKNRSRIPEQPPLVARSLWKRALDIAFALPALLMFLPVLLLIALIVRIETPGPALFRQRRGGLAGRTFVMYKFRSMTVQEDGRGVRHCTREDPRVTAFGAFLRRTSLDELPQLLNVLKGDMSLVGPRPHALAHDEYYGSKLTNYAGRSRAKPGLTGLAQVSGWRGEIDELESMARRVAHDIEYIDGWTLYLDIKLIFLTFARLPFDQRAY
jgi:putative colanic acid biosynthesis UDP-glucose lipid carrier transferase